MSNLTDMLTGERLPPVHPGKILREEFLEPMNLSVSKLANSIGIPVARMKKIVAGQEEITTETAARLGDYFEIRKEFWIDLQAHCSKQELNSYVLECALELKELEKELDEYEDELVEYEQELKKYEQKLVVSMQSLEKYKKSLDKYSKSLDVQGQGLAKLAKDLTKNAQALDEHERDLAKYRKNFSNRRRTMHRAPPKSRASSPRPRRSRSRRHAGDTTRRRARN